MKTERQFNPMSGYLGLVLIIAIAACPAYIAWQTMAYWVVVFEVIPAFMISGFVVVNPNESSVLTLFGAYKGSIKENGFFYVNPFFLKRKISLRARNLNSDPLKVNDKVGNPIMIGIVLVWKVEDTFRAAFEVDDYIKFVQIQSEAAIRKLAGHYPYDNFDDEMAEITLRAGGEEVNILLEKELTERLFIAGINVIESRIAYLAYASEIAHAMLQRQQATAVVAARFKIVEGACSMVEMALEHLSSKKIIDLDEEHKASMVSNLMVVLCAEKSASPVVNTGTLSH